MAGGSPFGRGLAAQPIGGRTYDNGDPTRETGAPSGRIIFAAPGGSRIVRGRFDDMQLRDEDEGQYLRARIYGPTDAQRATRDFGAAYGQPSGVTHDLGPVEVAPSEPGTTAEAWLFTVCRPDPGTGVFTCPDVPPGSDSFGRFGTIKLTLEDPDDPEIQIDAQPPIGDGWINQRRTQRLTARATDPSSGIERIRVQLRRGPSTRTLTDRDVPCDRRHRTAGREGLVCPATASATATDPARDSSSRPREYVVTAWDYAGNRAQQTVTVRRDVTRPSSGRLSGELTELARDWTNRQGDVPVTLRGRDGQSGVARLELIADRVAGRRPTVLAASQPACERGCTSAAETTTARLDRNTLPRDGRYRLSVRVTDRAGNQREFRSASTLKLDRAAPRRAGRAPFYRILRDGRVRVYFQPGRDPRESSGLGDFIVRYTPRDPAGAGGSSAVRFASVRMASASVVRYQRSRYRTLTLRGVDLSQPLAATQAGCDDARNGTPQPQYGGASENCSELITLRAIAVAFDERRAAVTLQPLLLFDRGEVFRPRNIDDLFKERDDGRPAHQVCNARRLRGDDCVGIFRPSVLYERDDYLDIRGSGRNKKTYSDPDRGRCTTSPRQDCGSGPGSAIYYNVTCTRRHLYADYWWFFRFNDSQRGPDAPQCRANVLCFDHEGDWEGARVVTSPTDSDDVQYVSYSAHGQWCKYPERMVQLSRGKRVSVYVARGTHANYPRPCSDDCNQTDDSSDGVAGTPETEFDGASPWERNDDRICAGNCLLPLPERRRDPDVSTFVTSGDGER